MFSKMSGCALCTLNLISCWYANKLFNLKTFCYFITGIYRCIIDEEVSLQ